MYDTVTLFNNKILKKFAVQRNSLCSQGRGSLDKLIVFDFRDEFLKFFDKSIFVAGTPGLSNAGSPIFTQKPPETGESQNPEQVLGIDLGAMIGFTS